MGEIKEIWKTIKKSGGMYEASNLGNIRNAKTKRQIKRNVKHNACVVNNKYFNTWYGPGTILETFKGECPSNCSYRIVHIDGDKTNWNIENLEWKERPKPINPPSLVEELVEQHKGLAYKVALNEYKWYRELNNYQLDDDLKQEAMVALVRSAQQFDTTKPQKFSTYAWKAVKLHILNEVIQKDKVLMAYKDYGIEVGSIDVPLKNGHNAEKEINFKDLLSDTDIKYNYVILDVVLRQILKDDELYIVHKMAEGIDDRDIASAQGVTTCTINRKKKIIREKVKIHYLNK